MKCFCMGIMALFLLGNFLLAEPRHATIEWSDGKKESGDASLTTGKDIRIFAGKALTTVRLDDVKEIQMNIEKEEMFEGFTFPEAGKAAKEKTGEVYPIRHFQTKILTADGKTVEGHLYTTTLYFESGENARKIVLFAKTKGENGQKLSDLIYPSKISFEGMSQPTASTPLDFSKSNLRGIKKLIVLSKPELTLMDAQKKENQLWVIPFGDASRLICAAECEDGLHVSWPDEENAEARKAVEDSLKNVTDFYDTVQILGSYSENENTDVYTLALLSRSAQTHSFEKAKIPWTVAVLRWKYDPEEKKTTLLNRMQLTTGRADDSSPLPNVVKDSSIHKLLQVASSVAGKGKENK